MSATAQTKVFGISLGIDPKILVLALIAVAALLFWFNSRGDDQRPAAETTTHTEAALPVTNVTKGHSPADRRRGSARSERGALRLRPVDATRGDVDPTLRLDFLERLSKVKNPSSIRNLFETGPAAITPGGTAVPNRIIAVKPLAPALPNQMAQTIMPQIAANVPYKYYGFAKPSNSRETSRGFFVEGDNIVVAVEGQLLQNRYLVVQLTPTSARIEDTQIKLGQTLQVVPEAKETPGVAGQVAEPEPNPGMVINQGPDDTQ